MNRIWIFCVAFFHAVEILFVCLFFSSVFDTDTALNHTAVSCVWQESSAGSCQAGWEQRLVRP